MEKEVCCYCDFEGTERSVRAHMGKHHRQEMQVPRRGALGRPPVGACPRCGMVHDPIIRPGWAEKRKKLERPHIAILSGRVPAEAAGKMTTIGKTVVPANVKKIRGIKFQGTAPATLRVLIEDHETGQSREYWYSYPGGSGELMELPPLQGEVRTLSCGSLLLGEVLQVGFWVETPPQ